MFLALLLSSVAAGLIATSIMLFFLYLPRLWDGQVYDVLGAFGSAITGREDSRSTFIGSLLYYAGGIAFALLYGWLVLTLMDAPSGAGVPQVIVLSSPVVINLVYPMMGLMVGLGHGGLVALLVTIVVIEHHPLQRFRDRYTLVVSQIIGHLVFGATVMFFQHQFLQLLLGRA